MKSCFTILLTLLIGLFMIGCSTVNKVSLDKDTISANASNASIIRNVDGSGVSTASENPVQIIDDDLNITTAGKISYVNIDTATGQFKGLLAKDAKLKNVKYTPQPKEGEPMFSAEEITITVSNVIAAADNQVINAQDKTAAMTEAEADARTEATKVISNAAKDIAKTITNSVSTDIADDDEKAEPEPETSE